MSGREEKPAKGKVSAPATAPVAGGKEKGKKGKRGGGKKK